MTGIVKWVVPTIGLCLYATGGRAQPSRTGSLHITLQPYFERTLATATVRLGDGRPQLVDSTGAFAVNAVAEGPLRIRVRRIGYAPKDTTVRIVAGAITRVRLTLDDYEMVLRQQSAAEHAASLAAGGLDSIAEGRVRRDTSGVVTWMSLSSRLLERVVTGRTPDTTSMVSGFSVGQALAVAMLGSGGTTTSAMQTALGTVGLSPDSLALLSQRFNLSLRSRRDVELKVANALWLHADRQLTPTFSRRIQQFAPGAVRSVDLFRESGIRQINAWADTATSGKIREVLLKPFTDDTRFVITNAVYLKATWLKPFDKSRTVPRPFTSASGRTVMTPTMEETRSFAYARDSGFQIVRVPFKAGLVAMYFVLPDSGMPIKGLLHRFSINGWPLPPGIGAARDVHLRLPRVHIEQELKLIPTLQSLGMSLAFNPEHADFRDLLQLAPKENTYINLLQQKLYLDLDETGAVAAAVTSVGGAVVTSAPPPPIEFFIDRPFLFLIQDERTGTVLFVGYVATP